jgi:hypothetical protein
MLHLEPAPRSLSVCFQTPSRMVVDLLKQYSFGAHQIIEPENVCSYGRMLADQALGVERIGIEPTTSCLQSRCSTN